MEIKILNKFKSKTFADLKAGDTFFLLTEYLSTQGDVSKVRMLMRCGHRTTDTDAVDLRTGTCWGFAASTLVVPVECELHIKEIKI